MKKQIFAAFFAFLTLFFCGIISASAATPEEIQAEEERVEALINSLDSEKITKITIEQFIPNQGVVINEAHTREAVNAWINLFKRMEITGVEYTALSGAFGTIYIHDERGKVRIGCLTGDYITNEGSITMCRIDNAVELLPDMESAVGMVVSAQPLKWWQKLPAWVQWIFRYLFFGWIWMK